MDQNFRLQNSGKFFIVPTYWFLKRSKAVNRRNNFIVFSTGVTVTFNHTTLFKYFHFYCVTRRPKSIFPNTYAISNISFQKRITILSERLRKFLYPYTACFPFANICALSLVWVYCIRFPSKRTYTTTSWTRFVIKCRVATNFITAGSTNEIILWSRCVLLISPLRVQQ